MKLLKAVRTRFPSLSQKQARELLRNKQIKINGRVAKISDLISVADEIQIPTEFLQNELKPNPDLNITLLKETDDFLFIDKPHRLHSVAQSFTDTDTVANWLIAHDKNLKTLDPLECGLGHRLDFETAGVMVAAKNLKAYEFLRNAFSQNKVEKIYQCVITDTAPAPGEYTLYFDLSNKNKRIVKTLPENEYLKPSITKILETKPLEQGRTELTIELVTGARHQIRCQLKELDAPILGDNLYGGQPHPELQLIAKSLKFTFEEKKYHAVSKFVF